MVIFSVWGPPELATFSLITFPHTENLYVQVSIRQLELLT